MTNKKSLSGDKPRVAKAEEKNSLQAPKATERSPTTAQAFSFKTQVKGLKTKKQNTYAPRALKRFSLKPKALSKPAAGAIHKKKGVVWIQCSSNNTIITLTDSLGNTRAFASGGTEGFKGSKRSTTYAAERAGNQIAFYAQQQRFQYLTVKLRGLSSGKRSALKGLRLRRKKIKLLQIMDQTPLPHNGCRASKKRRI